MIFLDVCFAPRQKLKPFTQTEEQRPGVLRLALDATQVRFLFFFNCFLSVVVVVVVADGRRIGIGSTTFV